MDQNSLIHERKQRYTGILRMDLKTFEANAVVENTSSFAAVCKFIPFRDVSLDLPEECMRTEGVLNAMILSLGTRIKCSM